MAAVPINNNRRISTLPQSTLYEQESFDLIIPPDLLQLLLSLLLIKFNVHI
jgi:hypothetical protein